MMLEYFKKRPYGLYRRSAIYITSSLAAYTPVSGVAAYCASKAFEWYFSDALHYELNDQKVDILSYTPAGVETKLNKVTSNMSIITPERAAHTSLRDLGYDSATNGSIRHDIINNVVQMLPVSFMSPFSYLMYK